VLWGKLCPLLIPPFIRRFNGFAVLESRFEQVVDFGFGVALLGLSNQISQHAIGAAVVAIGDLLVNVGSG
jgi:hypothetical protein